MMGLPDCLSSLGKSSQFKTSWHASHFPSCFAWWPLGKPDILHLNNPVIGRLAYLSLATDLEVPALYILENPSCVYRNEHPLPWTPNKYLEDLKEWTLADPLVHIFEIPPFCTFCGAGRVVWKPLNTFVNHKFRELLVWGFEKQISGSSKEYSCLGSFHHCPFPRVYICSLAISLQICISCWEEKNRISIQFASDINQNCILSDSFC